MGCATRTTKGKLCSGEEEIGTMESTASGSAESASIVSKAT